MYSSHTWTPCAHGGHGSLILYVKPHEASSASPSLCTTATLALPVHMEVRVYWFYLSAWSKTLPCLASVTLASLSKTSTPGFPAETEIWFSDSTCKSDGYCTVQCQLHINRCALSPYLCAQLWFTCLLGKRYYYVQHQQDPDQCVHFPHLYSLQTEITVHWLHLPARSQTLQCPASAGSLPVCTAPTPAIPVHNSI